MKRISLTIVFAWLITLCHAGDWERYFSSIGLVDVLQMDTTLRVDLKYATSGNLFGEPVYKAINGIWLHPDAARKLIEAQRLLKKQHPSYSLVVYDAARPMSVQRKMWNLVRGTTKTNYVSNPANGGGLHNYGMAVDAGILAPSGEALPMGSPFDHFGEESHTGNEDALLQSGKITPEEYHNRRLLRQIMREAGFRAIPYEWWHFNACSRETAKSRYLLIE